MHCGLLHMKAPIAGHVKIMYTKIHQKQCNTHQGYNPLNALDLATKIGKQVDGHHLNHFFRHLLLASISPCLHLSAPFFYRLSSFVFSSILFLFDLVD